MALTDRSPFRIARRFWHGWTRALPAQIVLGALFTFAFLPIAVTPLVDAHGVMHEAAFVSIGLSIFLLFLSWAVGGHAMRDGYTLSHTIFALPGLVGRALLGVLLFALVLGGPLTRNVAQQVAQQGGIALAVAAGFLAFGFFLLLDWSLMAGQRTPKTPAPAHRSFLLAIPLALWDDLRRLGAFLRGVWRRTPLALGAMAAGFFVLSLLLIPTTALLGLLWPNAPLWAGVFFSFVVFSSMPSLAAAALADAKAQTTPKVA